MRHRSKTCSRCGESVAYLPVGVPISELHVCNPKTAPVKIYTDEEKKEFAERRARGEI